MRISGSSKLLLASLGYVSLLAYVVLGSICGYNSIGALSVLAVLIGSCALSVWLSSGICDAIFKGEEIPGPRDVMFHDRCTVRCRTASFRLLLTRTQVGELICFSLIVSSALSVLVVGSLPLTGRELFSPSSLVFTMTSLTLCFIVSSALLVALTLGFVGFPRMRGDRRRLSIALLSLGYCEAELITDVEVEVSGFRELGSYPVRYGKAPGGQPSNLRIRVGYFRPGPCKVEVRDCDFLFLRTRGVCVLHDAQGLPKDREEAFHLLRWWEKFSMVYAALCLEKEESPEPEEVDGLLGSVVNNRAGWNELVYLNRRFSLTEVLRDYEVAVGVLGTGVCCLVMPAWVKLIGVKPSLKLLHTWWYLAPAILLIPPVSALGVFVINLNTALRSWRLVREGRVYESVLGRDPYDGKWYEEWLPRGGDPIASRHRESESDEPQSG